MVLHRLSPRTKAGLAVALALLLWIPQGISTQNMTAVTGHSTFLNGTGYDKCLASIAGIMRSRVMWFNDQVLVERYGGKGTFIYATEHGSEDPTTGLGLWSEGVFYDFVDPNGAHWHVEETFMIEGTYAEQSAGGDPLRGETPTSGAKVSQDRTYVWIVELSAEPIHDQFAGAPDSPNYHDLYNFLLLIDTCKMHRKAYNGNETHDGAVLGPGYGHEIGAKAHEHETFLVDLYVHTRPVLVPFVPNAQESAQFESEWATAPNTPTYTARAPGQAVNQTT